MSDTTSSLPLLSYHASLLSSLSLSSTTSPSGPPSSTLIIFAKGLGQVHLLSHFALHYTSSASLLLLLKCSSSIVEQLNASLPPHLPRITFLTNATSATERKRLYFKGGLISVTSRILIVDLLNGLLPASLISGVLINRAEECTEHSLEAFALRVTRQKNNDAFLLALSEQPQLFVQGLFPLDKAMRALHCRSLHLVPRFLLAVQEALAPHQTLPLVEQSRPKGARASNKEEMDEGGESPDIVQMLVSLTPLQTNIQRALLECMDLCISGLKAENKLGSATLAITLENSLSKQIDVLIRQELDPQWNKVSTKSKHYLSDITSLRRCIEYLTSCDAVTFYKHLLLVRTQASHQRDYSTWLLAEPADRLFRLAKARVYEFYSSAQAAFLAEKNEKADSAVLQRARQPLLRGKGTREEPEVLESTPPEQTTTDSITLILEENPKWAVLREIVDEIEKDVRVAQQKMYKSPFHRNQMLSVPEGRVLVCCADRATCTRLTRYLEKGGPRLMKQQWQRFLRNLKPKRRPLVYHEPEASTVASPRSPTSDAKVSTAPPKPSAFSVIQSENNALRDLAEREYERLRVQRLKKFERERKRALELESKAKRTKKIGADQITLTQHFSRSKHEAKEQKYARSSPLKRKTTDHSSAHDKDRRLAALGRDAEFAGDEEDSVLQQAVEQSLKRQKKLDPLPDEEEEDADRLVACAQDQDTEISFSICDLQLHLTQTQEKEHHEDNAHAESMLEETPKKISKSQVNLEHDFDEHFLQALPSFQIMFQEMDHIDALLYRYRPEFIVMYDVDLKLIREIEVYAASVRSEVRVRVYFCMYRQSLEEQRYMNSVTQEKEAFDKLIAQKAHLIVPSAVPGRSVGLTGADELLPTAATNPLLRAPRGDLSDETGGRYSILNAYESTIRCTKVNTRHGGDMPTSGSGRVLVDVREFRSSLPSQLHARGLTIVPVTLQVGDFVLTPHLVVERKSVSDLFGSFQSGRLLKQLEAAARYYRNPILLIEFDRKRPFQLIGKHEIDKEINSKSILSKIALTCVTFPQVRLLWTRDSHSTSTLFLALKEKQPEPEVDPSLHCSSDGLGSGTVGAGDITSSSMRIHAFDAAQGGVDGDVEDDRNDAMTSYDMLRKMPGVNAQNIRALVEKVRNLKDLCSTEKAPLKMLKDTLGETQGMKLYKFLHSDVGALYAL